MPDDLKAIVQRMLDAGESEENIATVIRHAAPSAAEPSGTHGGLPLSMAGPVTAGAANIAERVATSPTLPRTAATVGRVIGGAAPVVGGVTEGIMRGDPMGPLVGVAGAAKGAWLGGKTGYFTGRLMQNVAAPIARGLERVAPIAERLNPLGVVQGGLDLAQMAEPQRKDIGLLGVGRGTADPHDPALLNAIAAKLRTVFGRQ